MQLQPAIVIQAGAEVGSSPYAGSDSIAARDHVRLLVLTLRLTSASTDTHTRLHRQHVMLLLATPASTFSAFTRHGIGCQTVHALVASRIDYCNAVLAGTPKVTTDKLQRVLNAAAPVVSGTTKFYRSSC